MPSMLRMNFISLPVTNSADGGRIASTEILGQPAVTPSEKVQLMLIGSPISLR